MNKENEAFWTCLFAIAITIAVAALGGPWASAMWGLVVGLNIKEAIGYVMRRRRAADPRGGV